jgi:type VI secretion system protein VasG
MIRIELSALIERLNAVCRQHLEDAASLSVAQHGAEVTVPHLLLSMLENPLGDARVLLSHHNLDVGTVRQALATGVSSDANVGTQVPSFSPLLLELLQEAWLLGSLELAQTTIRSGAVLLAALLQPGRYLPLAAVRVLAAVNRETLRAQFGSLLALSVETPTAQDSPALPERDTARTLSRYGHDLTARARAGRIDPVLCRDREIDQMIDVLSRRRKNNPIVVGDAGVGKSALVEGLALRIVDGRVPAALRSVALWSLDLGALQAGASIKGEFEKRLKAVIDEVREAPEPIILFIDEAHTLIGAGNVAGGSDAANLLKPALARGELRTIAATTWSEYKKHIEKDPALSRRFELVKITEPTPDQVVHILRGLRPAYEKAHGVYIDVDALHAAASLSARYLAGRQLPDKAIDVLDTACARVAATRGMPPRELTALENQCREIDAEIAHLGEDRITGRTVDDRRLGDLDARRHAVSAQIDALDSAWRRERHLVERVLAQRSVDAAARLSDTTIEARLPDLVAELAAAQGTAPLVPVDVGREQVAQVIAEWTGIPAATISVDRMARLRDLPALLAQSVKGQGPALSRIHRFLLTAMADLRRPGTPLGAFLLVGPSGVGKTETAVAIAEALFGGMSFLTVLNLSEYQEKHTVSRLLGAPPGYVGYGEGGVLTEAIRQRPYAVVLLDEVEKAHPDVLSVFYQAFDKGEIVDGEGRTIDCRNILFVLTSNLAFDTAADDLPVPDTVAVREALLAFFKPALLARMQVVPYAYLDETVLGEIVEARLHRVRGQLATRYDAKLVVTDAVVAELKSRCLRHADGARLLDASIDGDLMPPLSLAVLQRVAARSAFGTAQLDWDGERFVAEVS